LAFLGLGSALQSFNLGLGIALTQLLVFALPAYLYLRASNLEPAPFLGMTTLPSAPQLALVFWIALANYPLGAGLMGLCRLILPEELQTPDAARILVQSSTLQQLVIIGCVCLLAPIGEELIFRGAFFRLTQVSARRPAFAFVLSAATFSLLHLDPIGFLPRFELGLLFAWLLYRTGSLWSPILAHMINNTVATGLFFLAGQSLEPETAAKPDELLMAILMGVALMLPALFLLRRKSAATRPEMIVRDPDRGTHFDSDSPEAMGLLFLMIGSVLLLLALAASVSLTKS